MKLDEALSRPTLSVPDAGAVFYGLSRNGSYEAAKRGDIQTIRIGRKIVVPVAPIAEKLGLRPNLGKAA
ncbi:MULTISPECIES: helix-turn-helix domain-containing protein [unclassified Mesorhizobium]|uniref:helix-turn-helix domain-containing protein n=1 Tax=unclassified Mesorhizobium TaxID=325217 RepID=UPI00112623E9|nr:MULTISPECIES: helix-turn-helix domain-containing protein [unclassified Mesorhizobium]TPK90556.1 helix-turn-helix domain-containing protein [Mesorhizobium sp. B2-4-17]TPK98878.1 helix-turn-helix domain-containing protein [Mesorhizobium sp. B2-4-14]